MIGSTVLKGKHVRRDLPSGRSLLAAVLLVLLSGLPQVGITLSSHEMGGERIGSVPLARSVLLDKHLPEASNLLPPHTSEFPPVLSPAPAHDPVPSHDLESLSIDIYPSPWVFDLTRRLYRHHSSYV